MISSKSLAKNFAIQTIGKVVTILMGLVALALITRTLGTERFGEYTTAITFLQFFAIIIDFGLSLSILIMISEAGADEERIVGNFFGLRLISGFFLFSLAPITVLLFPWSQTIKEAVLIGAVAFFLNGGISMLGGIFQRHESMWRSSVAELIGRIVFVILVAAFAFTHLGVTAFVWASVITNIVWLSAIIYFAQTFVRIRPRFEKNVWKEIFFRSWPLGLSTILNLMYLKGDILILSYFRTQTEVGLYGATYRILDVLTTLPFMFIGLLLPSLVFAWTNGNHEQFKNKLSRTFDLFMISVIPIIVGTQIVGVKLMEFVAGHDYAPGGEILKTLILALFSIVISVLFGHIVVVINKQRLMLYGYAAVAILTLIGYFYFIPLYGITGAAWMTVFSETAIAIITFATTYYFTRAAPNLHVFFKACLASAMMFGCLQLLPGMHVLFEISIGALIYLITIFLLKGIHREDINILIPDRFRKL